MTHIQTVYLVLYIVFGIIFVAGIILLLGAGPWTTTVTAENCLGTIGFVCTLIGFIAGIIVLFTSMFKVDMQVDYYQGLLKERIEYEKKVVDTFGPSQEAYKNYLKKVNLKISKEESTMTVADWNEHYERLNKK